MYDEQTCKTAQEGVSHVLERTKDLYLCDHAKTRMRERDISVQQIKAALLYGRVIEGHEPLRYPRGGHPNQNSDPVFSFSLAIAQRTLCVAVAMVRSGARLRVRVVTEYWK